MLTMHIKKTQNSILFSFLFAGNESNLRLSNEIVAYKGFTCSGRQLTDESFCAKRADVVFIDVLKPQIFYLQAL